MPPCITIHTESAPKLTGRTRHRETFFGRMYLQVEESWREGTYRRPIDPVKWGRRKTRWRNATINDVAELGL